MMCILNTYSLYTMIQNICYGNKIYLILSLNFSIRGFEIKAFMSIYRYYKCITGFLPNSNNILFNM